MKRIVLLLCFLSFLNAEAQYIFTATDVDGNTHDIQEYLDQGKPVLILEFVNNWGFYWSLHEYGSYVELYNTIGQGGTGDIVVLYIAGYGFNSEADIYDVDYSFDLGAGYESVDLTEGHDIPLIVAAENQGVSDAVKGGSIWVCPYNDYASFLNDFLTPEELLESLYSGCCTSLEGEDVALWGFQTASCDPTSFSYSIVNESEIPQDEVSVDVYQNGNFVETVIYDEVLEGCTSVGLDYNNDLFQGGDVVTFAIGQANWNQANDTLEIQTAMVDTTGTTLKLELINPLSSSNMSYLIQGSGGMVTASTNWYNYLFLDPGCYLLEIGAFPGPIQDQALMVGTVDGSDSYTDTLFFGEITSGEFFIDFTINVMGDSVSQKVWGYLFEDINEEGVFDPALTRIEGIEVNYGSLTTFTDSEGYYEFPEWIPGENVSISYDEAVWPVYTTPGAGSVGSDNFIQNFGLNSDDPVFNLDAIIDMGLPYLCEGLIFNSFYIDNAGNQPTSGELIFTHDPLLTPVSYNPEPTSINGNVLTYDLGEIQYGGGINFDIGYQELSADLLGELLTAEYILNTFDDQGNNVDTESEIITDTLFCSYDPNDKYGFPLGMGEEGLIEADTPLKYRIRFQNTGNLPATTVVIRDTLPEELEWESFEPGPSSHQYSLLMDSQSREVVWTFNDIMLPDSASDPEGSIGTLWFDIDMTDLEPGDEIENTAYIFFDANEAIVTNTSLHTIGEFLSTTTKESSDFSVYPNPSEGMLFIKGTVSTGELARITDLSGRVVWEKVLESNRLDVSDLNSGMYLLSIGNGPSVKVLVRKNID